jgi:choline dehydrogenase
MSSLRGEEHFDLVVIGAGPGGSAVAARASADPDLRVLVIERGPDWRVADAPPEMYAHRWIAYMGLESLARFHSMESLARKTATHEPRLYLSGQGLGGSSIINGQATLRPPLDEYDVWSDLGATRWSSQMALDLWRRIECDHDFGDTEVHGSDGPLSVERTPREEWSTLDHAFWQAACAAGYGVIDDLNGTAADGLGPIPFSRRNGQRVTANHAYLDGARERPNLTIRAETLVDRVEFDHSGSRVVGVTVVKPGGTEFISADYVVCAAGTLNTAAILLRSGIGPADDLTSLGLKVNQDLPVGRGIQDHLMFTVSADWTLPEDPDDLAQNWASCAVRYSSDIGDAPPGDMLMLPTGPLQIFDMRFPPSLAVWNLETFSRGSMRLVSTDPAVAPDVCIGMYSDERDLLRMRDGARRIVSLLDSPAFAGLRGSQRRAGVVDIELADMDDDQAVDAMLRNSTELHAHVSASAPMGAPGSERAVVDTDARVIGVDGLWISDLSICPKVTRAGTYPTAVLIGEFVADSVTSAIGIGAEPRAATG